MIDRRILVGFYCLSLPALLITGLSVRLYLKYHPLLIDQDRLRRTAVYREVAEGLQDHPEQGVVATIPADHGRMRYMRPGRWGYVESAHETVVWYLHDTRAQQVTVPLADALTLESLLLPILFSTLSVLWLMTVIGCFLFYRMIKERDDFIAATAHDLTTPLVALRRLITRDAEESARVTEQLIRLVKNLTDYLKLDGRRQDLAHDRFDLRAAFDVAYALFREDFRFVCDGRDLEIVGPENLMVSADETKTVQILWNLLANELKYAAPYGRVGVLFENDGKFVRAVFRDEGPGLSAVERRKIFRRYYRAKNVIESGKGGFGIGLCTARSFARLMGGDLTVSANKPKGCVFTLVLRSSM